MVKAFGRGKKMSMYIRRYGDRRREKATDTGQS
jgi:hypothetical protein